MWCSRLLLAGLLCAPSWLPAAVSVNDGGVWKDVTEIHVKDGGVWKAAQEVHVKDGGAWQLVFSLTPSTGALKIEFGWEVIPKDLDATPTNTAWAASTAYALGYKQYLVGFDSIYAEVTTAGTSGATQPTWPAKELLTAGEAVTDNGNGTVNIPCMNTSAILSGNTITLAGTANYDGTYVLGTQATPGQITITATYVPETIFSGMAVKASGLTVADSTVVWTIKEYGTGLTGYNIYLNDTLLCTATGKTEVSLVCNDVPALGEPAYFTVTHLHVDDGESLPSAKVWAAGYPDWTATTAYALGDKINAGENWAHSVAMTVVTAGTSGATEPVWPVRKLVSRSIQMAGPAVNAATGAAIDNGDGTVNIPVKAHGFIAGDVAYIGGTENYAGQYVLGAQANPDQITITKTFVAEDFGFNEYGNLPLVWHYGRDISGAAINNGNGTVNIPCSAHGFVSGNTVFISGTTSYNGSYTLATQANPDQITITKTFVAETFDKNTERASGTSLTGYPKEILPAGTYLTATGHGIADHAAVTVNGTTNYDGMATAWTIDANTLFVAKPFVEETLAASAIVYQGAVVNNGSGTINIPFLSHGFVAGDEVTLTGISPWEGVYTLGTQNSTDFITITGSFIAKDVSGAAVAKKVSDGTVEWELSYE